MDTIKLEISLLLLAQVHVCIALYHLQTALNALLDTTKPFPISNVNYAVIFSIIAQNVLRINVWNAKLTIFFSIVPSANIPAKLDVLVAIILYILTVRNA